jgi:hypothetical protein
MSRHRPVGVEASEHQYYLISILSVAAASTPVYSSMRVVDPNGIKQHGKLPEPELGSGFLSSAALVPHRSAGSPK